MTSSCRAHARSSFWTISPPAGLDVDVAEQVISGIAEGCRQSACALLGGETAEMPDMYAEGEYDLAGFCVDAPAGQQRSGGRLFRAYGRCAYRPGLFRRAHSNGYSLIRKLFNASGLKGGDTFPAQTKAWPRCCLSPPIFIRKKCATSRAAISPLKA